VFADKFGKGFNTGAASFIINMDKVY